MANQVLGVEASTAWYTHLPFLILRGWECCKRKVWEKMQMMGLLSTKSQWHVKHWVHKLQPHITLKGTAWAFPGMGMRYEPGGFNYHQHRKERDFFYSWMSAAWGSSEFFFLMAASHCLDIISSLARNACHLKAHTPTCWRSASGWLHSDLAKSRWDSASFFGQMWVFFLLMQLQPHCSVLKHACFSPSSTCNTERVSANGREDKLGATVEKRKK